jgi:hypothetical protein
MQKETTCNNCKWDPKIEDYEKICNHPDGIPEDDEDGICKGWENLSSFIEHIPDVYYSIID